MKKGANQPLSRSDIMRRVHSSDTGPEKTVRSWLYRRGYRYRLQRKDLPGAPDIVLTKRHLAIFVHGCFWHRHPECKRATFPKSNTEYWKAKFDRNVARDQRVCEELKTLGWTPLVIWECEITKGTFEEKLVQALKLDSEKEELH